MHAGQLTVSTETVRDLVGSQFPEWRELPVEPVVSDGTANAIYRIGARFAARFPLEPDDVEQTRRRLESEAESAASLVGRTRFSTPEPVALGEPGAGFPLPWAVQTWVSGEPASGEDHGDGLARDLAEFIGGVRRIDTGGRTFGGSGRGGELWPHDDWMQECLSRSEGLLDVRRLRSLWSDLRELPRGVDQDVTNHGDLIPGNVLLLAGRLRGVIDVGWLGPADPALDLVCAWHLFDAGPRRVLRAALGCDDAEWARGRAWAFQQAMGLVWYYVDSNPPMSDLGRRTLARILAD